MTIFRATDVPVGEDQHQHLQMVQQIVKTFNHRMGYTFPTPKALIQGKVEPTFHCCPHQLLSMNKDK